MTNRKDGGAAWTYAGAILALLICVPMAFYADYKWTEFKISKSIERAEREKAGSDE